MKRFNIVSNGYDVEQVNRFIDIVIERMDRLNHENVSFLKDNNILKKKIADLENMNNQKIEKALIAVQDTGDRIKELAKEEADMILSEAKNNAASIVHEALVKAEKIEHNAAIMEKNTKVYKNKVKSLLEAELSIIDELDKKELTEE